jgi:type I restriction enzyme S subunit
MHVPDGWSKNCLLDVADVNPESLGVGVASSYEFRYIDITSVTMGVIVWSTVTTQRFASAPSRARRIVRPSDVLLCTVRPGLQSHAIADWTHQEGVVCSTGFAVLRSKPQLHARYLFHLLFGPKIVEQLRALVS